MFRSITCIFLLALASFASDQPTDFSGNYASNSQVKDASGKHPKTLIKVVQTSDSLEISTTTDGKTTTRKLRLDGSVTTNPSPRGIMVQDRATLKGKSLLIQTLLPGTDPRLPGTVEEKWELSKNLDKLKVATTLRAGNVDAGSFEETYIRTTSN